MTRNEILEAACQFYSPETVTEREIAFARHMVKWTLSEREWVGLTDEEIAEIYIKWDATPGTSMADFARAIEAAHGIKGEA